MEILEPLMEITPTPDALTAVVQVLDTSGSMSKDSFIEEVRTGYNTYIKDLQDDDPGSTLLFTVSFSNKPSILVNGEDVKTAKPLTQDKFFASGSTALNDAVGLAIRLVDEYETQHNVKFDNVSLEIQTDGMENASTEYSARNPESMEALRNILKDKQEKQGWVVSMVGADQSVFDTASNIGFTQSSLARTVTAMDSNAQATEAYFTGKGDLLKSLRAGTVNPENFQYSTDFKESLSASNKEDKESE